MSTTKQILEEHTGKHSLYLEPTKFCPNGCAHCYYASPDGRDPEYILSDEIIQDIIDFTHKEPFEKIFITGGGEPLTEMENVQKLLAELKCEEIMIHTSGHLFDSVQQTHETLKALDEAVKKNPYKPFLIVRMSVDNYHKIKVPLDYGVNFITAVKDFDMGFGFHSLEEDPTIDELRLLLEADEAMNLPDGRNVRVSRSIRLRPNFNPDLSKTTYIQQQIELFDTGRTLFPATHRNRDGKKGMCYCIYNDGSVELWNTAPADNRPNLNDMNMRQAKEKIIGDPITLAMLARGNEFIDKLIEEVAPKAVRLAKAYNTAALFNTRAISTPETHEHVRRRIVEELQL